mmetsp:Transcript_125857/g.298774  ORF Transcript_125857/g.298774 Transcript_125857/m.298774 type:complete len:222 (+) Transcript_125857:51-716(+)
MRGIPQARRPGGATAPSCAGLVPYGPAGRARQVGLRADWKGRPPTPANAVASESAAASERLARSAHGMSSPAAVPAASAPRRRGASGASAAPLGAAKWTWRYPGCRCAGAPRPDGLGPASAPYACAKAPGAQTPHWRRSGLVGRPNSARIHCSPAGGCPWWSLAPPRGRPSAPPTRRPAGSPRTRCDAQRYAASRHVAGRTGTPRCGPRRRHNGRGPRARA